MLKSNNNIVGVVHGTDGNNNCWGVRITEDMIASEDFIIQVKKILSFFF